MNMRFRDTKLKIHRSTNDFFDGPYFRLNKISLSIMGQWPYQHRKLRITIVTTICVTLLSVFIPEVIYFVEVFQNMNKMIDCLPALIITYVVYVMIFNGISNIHMTKEILEEIMENWKNAKDVKELAIFEKYAKVGKFFIVIHAVVMTATVSIFSITPLVPKVFDFVVCRNESQDEHNILEVQYYVDRNKYYWPIYIHGLQASFSVVFTIFTFDTYYLMVVQQACSMFVVLGYRIDKIDQQYSRKNYNFIEYDMDKLICSKIIECTKYHRDCIRFAELIENSFVISWFMQIFLNMIIISITGVQTITRTNNPTQMFRFGFNMTCVIFRLFYITWPGQKILDHSFQVHELICNITWYDFPPNAKKLLLFMLLRSSKPCNITAGKIISLNFKTYCTLIQTSMSYFTMILSTR